MKASFLSFSVICLIALTACGNSKAVNKLANSSTEVTQSTQPEQPTALPISNSKIKADLEKAKKEGKAVFVVVTGTGVAETDKATTIAKGANAIYKNAAVVQLDRDDAANTQLVTEWRLAGAPLPLVLVISPKGQLTGGMILAQATAESIAALVPSPKLEEVYASIAANKPETSCDFRCHSSFNVKSVNLMISIYLLRTTCRSATWSTSAFYWRCCC